MIENKEAWARVKETAQAISGPSLRGAVETIEALRDVARAANAWFEIEYKSGGKHFTSAPTEYEIKRDVKKRAKDALARIESEAPWLLEEDE